MRLASLALVPALVLAACSGGGAGATTGAAPLSLTLTEFKYNPGQLQVAANTPAKLTIKNGGSVDHDFTFEKAGIAVSLKPGASADKELAALPAGTYDFFCSVPGHKEAGMVGKLIVK